jgi:hypothetical protein
MFELSRLLSYDDASLIAELRRVAKLVNGVLTQAEFRKRSKASPSIYRRRFGSWETALIRAGFGDRYSGRSISDKMRRHTARGFSDDQLLDELRRVAAIATLTTETFNEHSAVSASVIRRRFGTWNHALKRAGLSPTNHGRRYSDSDYYENLLLVWSHLGRQPSYNEMNLPPSRITAGGYEKKWGTWRKALLAFIAQVSASEQRPAENLPPPLAPPVPYPQSPERDPRRKVPLGLRFQIFQRDQFTCVLCGASPAKGAMTQLHADHIIPWSKGGKTARDNLRTLCDACNIGRGNAAQPRD